MLTQIYEKPRHGGSATRRSTQAGTVLTTYVVLGDETGDEVEIIIEVKAAAEFESAAEACHGGRLGRQLLHASHTTKLLVGLILRHGQSWCPAIPASVVVVGHSGGGRGRRLLMVGIVVVVLRHDCDWMLCGRLRSSRCKMVEFCG